MSLLTAPIAENNHILAKIYFIFLKKCLGLKLKVFWYQIVTSVLTLEKELTSKTKFSTFLQASCSKFNFKLR